MQRIGFGAGIRGKISALFRRDKGRIAASPKSGPAPRPSRGPDGASLTLARMMNVRAPAPRRWDEGLLQLVLGRPGRISPLVRAARKRELRRQRNLGLISCASDNARRLI